MYMVCVYRYMYIEYVCVYLFLCACFIFTMRLQLSSRSLELIIVIMSGLIYKWFLFFSLRLTSLTIFTQWTFVIRKLFKILLQQFHFLHVSISLTKTIYWRSFPSKYSWLHCQNQLSVYVGVHLWALEFVPFVYKSVFMPISCCFNYYSL